MKCDFCSELSPAWWYRANDFEVSATAGPNGIEPILHSIGKWAACETCHGLIEVADRSGLMARMRASFEQTTKASFMMPDQAFHNIVDAFFANKQPGGGVVVQCLKCKKEIDIEVTDAQLAAWRGGELIQKAMPHLSADERELLISSICGPCFDQMFENLQADPSLKETDIITVSDAIEIHPTDCGDWSVVRHGNVYGTYEDLSYAREIADELADNE